MLRIISANLNGIRSASSKGFYDWLQQQNADLLCMQELKAQAPDMSRHMLQPDDWFGYFHYAEKKGYSGVGIYSRKQPDAIIEGLGMPDIDAEGRYIEARFGNLSVVSLYLPSGSSGEERQAVKFSVMERFYPHLAALKASGREVVVCGDWNIAHQEADLKNWRGNRKNSGFLPEERAWMTRIFNELGWVDVYRRLHPDTTDECYTWWSNRGQAWAKNVGWRIDYQIATPGIAAKALSTSVYKDERFSDHAPLTVDYDV
ncbi:MAG TPA: exodeoxyribonuclease III [Methylophilaceae bacterium]|nr:exodeoxyribonuclease III [Methylophilaceae bacterium]HQR60099.1 exodeoxyribonuclease III [Methylophilaceae bacterium]